MERFLVKLSRCSRRTRAEDAANEEERERIGATSESGSSHLEDALVADGAAARRFATSSWDVRTTGRRALARWVMDIQMATSRSSTLLGVAVASPGHVERRSGPAGLGAASRGGGRWVLAEAEAAAPCAG
eukprot:16440570-Heterocapsa_arctica.AAC.1